MHIPPFSQEGLQSAETNKLSQFLWFLFITQNLAEKYLEEYFLFQGLLTLILRKCNNRNKNNDTIFCYYIEL